MKEKLKKYIKDNYESKPPFFGLLKRKKFESEEMYECCFDVDNSINKENSKCNSSINVDNFIHNNKDENNFQKLLFKYIDDRNLKDSDVYNKVHIDRRLFSKIRNDINYHPSRETIILLGLSLELNEDEIIVLLSSASYSLAKNNYYDLIIRFCFIEGIYKLTDVNDLLESYNCKLFNY